MFQFRRANLSDIPFLTQAILSAESFFQNPESQNNTYCQVFNLTRTEAENLISEMLEQEAPGSEFYHESFILATLHDVPVAACSAWIEDEANPSSTLKAHMIYYILGSEKWADAQNNLQSLSKVNLKRTPQTLQLEAFYTIPEARGNRLAATLIKLQMQNNPNIPAEIQLIAENEPAIHAYTKAGFTIDITSERHEEVKKLLGGSAKIKMIYKS